MSGKQLTESIRDVAETLGVELASDLVDNFGGVGLYVPMQLKAHSDILKKLGLKQAQALVSEFGGKELDVPMHLFNEEKARRVLVITMRGKKFTIAQIARKAGCTERRVSQILADVEMKTTATLF